MDHSKIKGNVYIVNGKIFISAMYNGDKEITDDNNQLVILKDTLSDTLFKFETEFQKQFVPTKDTKYILPPEQ